MSDLVAAQEEAQDAGVGFLPLAGANRCDGGPKAMARQARRSWNGVEDEVLADGHRDEDKVEDEVENAVLAVLVAFTRHYLALVAVSRRSLTVCLPI